MWRPRLAVCFVAIVVGAAATGACGTAPATGSRAAASDFGHLVRFPRSEPLGKRSTKDGVTAQTFLARGTSPAAVLEYFRHNLSHSWHLVERPQREGTSAVRGVWDRRGKRLLVTAAPAPAATSSAANCQYSVSVGPVSAQPIREGD